MRRQVRVGVLYFSGWSPVCFLREGGLCVGASEQGVRQSSSGRSVLGRGLQVDPVPSRRGTPCSLASAFFHLFPRWSPHPHLSHAPGPCLTLHHLGVRRLHRHARQPPPPALPGGVLGVPAAKQHQEGAVRLDVAPVSASTLSSFPSVPATGPASIRGQPPTVL